MARCVRREPNGDAVRCVVDMGSSGRSAEGMVAAAARLDLVSNAFKDGVHGALVSSRLQVCTLRLRQGSTFALVLTMSLLRSWRTSRRQRQTRSRRSMACTWP